MRIILSHYNSLVLLYKEQEIVIQLHKKFRVTAIFTHTKEIPIADRLPYIIQGPYVVNKIPPHFNTSRLHYVAITDSTNYCYIKISVFMQIGQRVHGRRGEKWTQVHTATQHGGLTIVHFIYQQIRSKNI